MNTNDTGREPTNAELERRFERWWNEEGVGTMPRYGQDQDEFNRSLTHAAWMNGAFVASGARPMPDTPAPGEERRTVCVYDKLDPDYVFRPDDAGEYRMQVDRRSETRPAPMPDTKLCGAVTQAGEDRKFRTCELPSGHEGRHESHLGGETVWWENNGPECEHGHLARVCVICELIAAEARIADLERENAALVEELDQITAVAHFGGLCNLTEPKTLTLIRRLTKRHFNPWMTTAERVNILGAAFSKTAPGKETPYADTDKQRDDASGLGDVSIDELIGGNS